MTALGQVARECREIGPITCFTLFFLKSIHEKVTTMLNTKSVAHDYRSYLWVPDDVVEVAEKKCLAAKLARSKVKSLSLCLRVLEVRKDARLKELDERGINEEELTEEMLWLDIEWPRLSRFSLHFCAASSLQKIFPVVMAAGFARQRYIKRDAKSGVRIGDDNGIPLIYATYQDAQDDSEAHPGLIVHQALFESEVLNKEIRGLGRSVPPPPPSAKGETEKNEGAQRNNQTGSLSSAEQPSDHEDKTATRVGNKRSTVVSNRNITPPVPKNQGVGTFAGPLYQHGTVAGTPPAPRDQGQPPVAQTNPVPHTQGGRSVAPPCAPLMERTPAPENQGTGAAVATLPHPNAKPPAQRDTGPLQNSQPPSPENAAPSPGGEDPLCQAANHKDITTKRESQHMEKETNRPDTCASGAVCVDISLFDFFQPWSQVAIMDLLTLIFPLPARSNDETVQLYEDTTARLVADPPLQSRGLVFAARLMYYLKDESSPCQWRPKLRALRNNPTLAMQPWHLTAQVVPIATHEMERADWWPQAISPSLGLQNPTSSTPNTLANANSVLAEVTVLDLAELAEIAPDQRQGMLRQEAIDLAADIRTALPEDEFPGVFTDIGAINRWQKARGYFVEFWPANGLKLLLYSDADFERVVSCAKWLATPELKKQLIAACADSQVA
jgi:hypothetical protein